jgi:hypothetical protein
MFKSKASILTLGSGILAGALACNPSTDGLDDASDLGSDSSGISDTESDADPSTGDPDPGDGDPDPSSGDGDPNTGDGDPNTGDGDAGPSSGEGDGDGDGDPNSGDELCEPPGDDCGDCMASHCCAEIQECLGDPDCSCFQACAAANPDDVLACADPDECDIPLVGLLDPNTVVGRMSVCTQTNCAQCL